MSMNDQEFDSFLWALENTGLSWAVDDLRIRDTKQKESLVIVEVERDQYRDLYDASISFADRYKAERNTAQAQLVAAAHLLERATSVVEQPALASDILSFLAKYEDRHAQGAQAGEGS